jgi:transposase InsO family protein
MNLKRRGKLRLPARVRQPLQQAVAVNHSWSMDFMSDSIMGVRKFRTFNVMDDCTREALAIEIDTSLSSKRIIRTLESVIAWRGKPTVIRTDNGPEFTSKVLSGGARNMKSRFNLFNTAGLCRTVTSKDSTACTAKPFWTPTCSPISGIQSPHRRMDRRIQRTKTP